jgi:hypothetical protein
LTRCCGLGIAGIGDITIRLRDRNIDHIAARIYNFRSAHHYGYFRCVRRWAYAGNLPSLGGEFVENEFRVARRRFKHSILKPLIHAFSKRLAP